jgi:hypothetical protein
MLETVMPGTIIASNQQLKCMCLGIRIQPAQRAVSAPR